MVILGASWESWDSAWALRLAGFAPAEGNCSMLLSAWLEGCPWSCAAQCFWRRGGSTRGFQMGDENSTEYGTLVGQGGGELVSSGSDLIAEDGK